MTRDRGPQHHMYCRPRIRVLYPCGASNHLFHAQPLNSLHRHNHPAAPSMNGRPASRRMYIHTTSGTRACARVVLPIWGKCIRPIDCSDPTMPFNSQATWRSTHHTDLDAPWGNGFRPCNLYSHQPYQWLDACTVINFAHAHATGMSGVIHTTQWRTPNVLRYLAGGLIVTLKPYSLFQSAHTAGDGSCQV